MEGEYFLFFSQATTFVSKKLTNLSNFMKNNFESHSALFQTICQLQARYIYSMNMCWKFDTQQVNFT